MELRYVAERWAVRLLICPINLPHKAPAPIITNCQSATIEYNSCVMVRCTKKVGRINIYQLFDN